MPPAPKTLEDLLIWLICAVVLGLSAAVVNLFRKVSARGGECEKALAELRNDFNKVKDSQLNDTREIVREAIKANQRGEERERLLSRICTDVMSTMADHRDVVYRAMKMLKRYDPDATPPPEQHPLPDYRGQVALAPTEKEKPVAKKRPEIRDDDTSALFKVNPPHRDHG